MNTVATLIELATRAALGRNSNTPQQIDQNDLFYRE
jgi:hypothetical protein